MDILDYFIAKAEGTRVRNKKVEKLVLMVDDFLKDEEHAQNAKKKKEFFVKFEKMVNEVTDNVLVTSNDLKHHFGRQLYTKVSE